MTVQALLMRVTFDLVPEVALYDAFETNDSAVKVLGDGTLKTIARELVESIRRNVSIDWTVRESARARLRVIVRRILRKYGYPPDKEKATDTVLQQAEQIGRCGRKSRPHSLDPQQESRFGS